MASPLTDRQMEVLTFYQDRHRETGLMPTLEEAARHFGFRSINSVRQHLRLIEKKGFLRRLPGRSRALLLSQDDIHSGSQPVNVPLLGRIEAGLPGVAEQIADDVLPLPSELFRGTQLFALRVHGMSMVGAGILDKDIAVLDPTVTARNGDIAAVLIDDDATLKRVFSNGRELCLKAENPAFADINLSCDSKRIRILGSLIGVVRKI